jgi:hypothetical protein
METLQPPLNKSSAHCVDKMKRMDAMIRNFSGTLDGYKICRIIYETFGIDYCKMPILEKEIGILVKRDDNASAAAIDHYLATRKNAADGPGISKMMNQLFGTNLEGIAALSRTRISLYSKGQWIARKDGDLFEIHTGFQDIDVKVIPSAFFTAQTGLHKLPTPLEKALVTLGYTFNYEISAYYYYNPEGQSVSDHFKHQTVRAITAVTNEHYSQL